MFATRNPLEPIEATELPPRGRAYGPSSIDSSSGKVKQTSAPGLRPCLRDLSTDFARIFVVLQLPDCGGGGMKARRRHGREKSHALDRRCASKRDILDTVRAA
jgi:hypothetical protein